MSKREKHILELITVEPMKLISIAAECGVTVQTIAQVIRRLHKDGKVYIARRDGYQQTAYFLAGHGNDVPKIALRESIQKIISERAMSSDNIANEIGAAEESVRFVINQMKAEGIQMHVKKWIRSNRGPMKPLWIMGEGEDATKPEKFTAAQKCRRWRNTKHGTERRKEYARTYESTVVVRKTFASKGVAGFDPLLAAIMGL